MSIIIAWDKELDIAVEPQRQPLNKEWAFFDYGDGLTEKKQYNDPVTPENQLPEITVSDIEIEINNAQTEPFSGMYYCNVGDTVSISGNLTIDDVIQNISFPVTLKMPLIRHANGRATDDEIYMNVNVSSGVLTLAGVIPRSGDWKISIDRNNDALKVIGAGFKLIADDITILA